MPPISPPDELARSRPPRLGIYGGTFDPIHIGHLIIASEMRAALDLDQILFVPANVPPHKDARRVTPARHRLAMLRIAVEDDPWFGVDTLELDREGRSYTAETLALIHERELDAELWFIMGGDSLADLHDWRTPERIVSLARLAVAVRSGREIDLAIVSAQVPETRGQVDVIPAPRVDVASHEIRERVRNGDPIRYLVPDSVVDYIGRHRLYRTPT